MVKYILGYFIQISKKQIVYKIAYILFPVYLSYALSMVPPLMWWGYVSFLIKFSFLSLLANLRFSDSLKLEFLPSFLRLLALGKVNPVLEESNLVIRTPSERGRPRARG